MTDPLRDALRECEAYFEGWDERDGYGSYGIKEARLLVAVQAALRSPLQPTQGFRAGAYERHMARTPRIATDEMVRLDVILRATADEHADVLRPKQVDALYDAAAVLAAMEPSK